MTTLQTIQQLLARELDLDAADLDPTRPLDELGIDSLAVMECLFKIEDEFKISVPYSGEALNTLQDIADMVDKRVRANAAEVS